MTTTIDNLSVEELMALEDNTSCGSYNKQGAPLVRGQGARLWDAAGNEFIDCVSGIGCANVGHSHPRVVAAISEQVKNLTVCSELYHHQARARLQGKLCELSVAQRVFLCNSGAEANEGAIKFSRLVTGRQKIVCAMRGFHGRTMGALSATWNKKYKEPFEPLIPHFVHVPYDKLDKLEEVVDDQTAAVLLEVIQGEGGVRPGSGDYLRGAQELCRKHGAFFAVDEVQSGMGRTGKLFAYQHHGLEPDLVCLAKALAAGIPMGAVLIGERVGAIGASMHGSTFGGNPIASVAALAVLEAMIEEDLPGRAEALGARLRGALEGLDHPSIREVRGLGLMLGVELKFKVAPVIAGLRERGVLAIGAGPRVLRLLPPLVISEEELDQVVGAIKDTLDAVQEQQGDQE
ncbi:MAG TPA: aspartate aminotransferase family protein [Planctomycetes bacterium]|nr:aspartate aminotransferase family protein [Planctomycetota bacterium]